MSKKLVIELQMEAANEATPIAGLLRKALIVATKLNLEDFKKWIDSEINGYGRGGAIPEYRKVTGELMAWNSVRRDWMPVLMQGKNTEEFRHRCCSQQVSVLEALVEKDDSTGTLHMPFSPELQYALADKELGFVPTLVVQRSQLAGILDAVRNVVLEWSLGLERAGIFGEGMSFSLEEKQTAASHSFHIGHFQGVIGDVHTENLQIGDYNSIHPKLKELGIAQDERNELENILDEFKTAEPSKKPSLVSRGSAWLIKNGEKLGALSDTIRGWFELLG